MYKENSSGCAGGYDTLTPMCLCAQVNSDKEANGSSFSLIPDMNEISQVINYKRDHFETV